MSGDRRSISSRLCGLHRAAWMITLIAVGGLCLGCSRGEFTRSASGLKYRMVREGTGATPGPRDGVLVHYRGWLDDGHEFDSTYARRMMPSGFRVDGVIPGWTEGLQLMKQGGMIELEVPPELGYGEYGSPPDIPPNATLHFEIELLEVHPAGKPAANPAEEQKSVE